MKSYFLPQRVSKLDSVQVQFPFQVGPQRLCHVCIWSRSTLSESTGLWPLKTVRDNELVQSRGPSKEIRYVCWRTHVAKIHLYGVSVTDLLVGLLPNPVSHAASSTLATLQIIFDIQQLNTPPNKWSLVFFTRARGLASPWHEIQSIFKTGLASRLLPSVWKYVWLGISLAIGRFGPLSAVSSKNKGLAAEKPLQAFSISQGQKKRNLTCFQKK